MCASRAELKEKREEGEAEDRLKRFYSQLQSIKDSGERQRTGHEDKPKKDDSGQELRPWFPCLKSSGCRSLQGEQYHPLPLFCLVVCRVCDSHHGPGKRCCPLSLAACQTWGFISLNNIATANKGSRPCPLPQQDKQWLS